MIVQNFPDDESEPPLFDGNAHFDKWDLKLTTGTFKVTGMRHNLTKEAHGICRLITPDGTIIMASYREGKQHGLAIYITKTLVSVAFFLKGECVS